MTEVLVAVDGSDHAHQAAEHAIDLAKERDATLHCLCVVDERKFGSPALSSDEASMVLAEDHGHECASQVREAAEAQGIPVVTDIRHGIPDEVILDYAADIGAEVIVMGRHGDHSEHIGGVRKGIERGSDAELVVVDKSKLA
ncbi:universal stress protein [Haloarchaeobius amylolyticus]|uniref:universal stress protein n=1 Tax=Haloarchaeobius amylolyticus TaxID=1198296 RepID=UPI00227212AD|nr:universal stress protein [Haloarchaeobius amylolyticus]